ncbi:MAG: hypothetical protein IJH88_09095 [Eggerthellaceae bacterium]|nr:hypothetical protein [Eggerthellaceae bacterium]
MPQVSLYVDESLMKTLRAEAASEGISLSKHVARRLTNASRCATASGLPDGYLETLYGCLIDDDTFTRPEQPRFSLDASRLAFD